MRMMREWAASVTCVDQEMSLANPLKRNSIVRSFGFALISSWPSEWASTAFSTSLEQCAQVQRDALAACDHPDVLVASSWGGAVALKLLADGSFSGPSVLLCPAYRAPEHWAGALGIERFRAETDATGDYVPCCTLWTGWEPRTHFAFLRRRSRAHRCPQPGSQSPLRHRARHRRHDRTSRGLAQPLSCDWDPAGGGGGRQPRLGCYHSGRPAPSLYRNGGERNGVQHMNSAVGH